MGIIHVYQRSRKQPKKPGWKKAEAEYQAWLRRVSSESTNFSWRNSTRQVSQKPVARSEPPVETTRQKKPVDIEMFRGGTLPVARPEIAYRDQPELLERELRARARRFNVAPIYNKGAAQFVSEDELKNTLSTNRRRG